MEAELEAQLKLQSEQNKKVGMFKISHFSGHYYAGVLIVHSTPLPSFHFHLTSSTPPSTPPELFQLAP